MMRAITVVLGGLVICGVVCSCSGNDDKQTEADMKKGFSQRPSRDQLPPAQQQRYDAYKKMAESMASNGPKAPTSGGN